MAEAESEHKLFELVEKLIHSPLEWVGRLFFKIIRIGWRDHPAPVDRTKTDKRLPSGPYETTRSEQAGDLLIFVPRGWDSRLLDDLTGGYGYSHVTVDCGETDLPTGKEVMIESTVGQVVQRKFTREYGERPFIRIPLRRVGVHPETFCDCVRSKLGQPYDTLEALTLADVDDPAKQICSDLAAHCLPEWLRQDIADKHRLRLLKGLSVSVHDSPSSQQFREFISPNGFAEYFQAPKGKKVTEPDQLVEPRPMRITSPRAVKRWAGNAAVGFIAGLSIWLLLRAHFRRR